MWRVTLTCFIFAAALTAADAQQQPAPPDPRLCPTELASAQGDVGNLYRAVQAATAEVQLLASDKKDLEKQVADLKKQLADAKAAKAPEAPKKK